MQKQFYPTGIQTFSEIIKGDYVYADKTHYISLLLRQNKYMPFEDQNEGVYRAVTYLLCKLCSLDVRAEQHSYRGRRDMEVLTRGQIYVFEFKYNKSVVEAMDQIRKRDYAGRYTMDSRKIYLIGANYVNSKDKRDLEYEIREFSK